MIRLFISLAAAFQRLLARAPSNLLLGGLRTRRGLNWAIPTGLVLATIYLFAASLTFSAVDHGASGWLNLLALLLCWNALRFGAIVPASLVWLAKVWIVEEQARRLARHDGYAPRRELGPWTTREGRP